MKQTARYLATGLLVAGLMTGGVVYWRKQMRAPAEERASRLNHAIQIDPAAPVTPSPEPIPPVKTLTNGRQVFQTFNNCGPASLSIALSYLGVSVSQDELGKALRPYQQAQGDNDDKSVSLSELAAKSGEYGLVAYHRPAGDVHLIQQFVAHNIPVITRTWLKQGDDIGHYRVIRGYDQTTQELIQDDSLEGANKRYRYQDFLRLWQAFNYEFLVLVPAAKRAEAEQILSKLRDEDTAWNTTLAMADKQIAQNPQDTYAQFNRSVALYHLGRYRESVDAYEQVRPKLPARMLWYQIEPVLAYYKLGDYDQVLQMSQTILNGNNRAFAELYYVQGKIYEHQQMHQAAADNFRLADTYNSTVYWKQNLSTL